MARKIVFMGTPEFSVKILDTLHKSDFEVVYVYTQPPKKSSRGMRTNISPVHTYAKKNNLNLRHPITLNSEEEFNFFKSINAQIIIVVAYGQIIPKKYLDIPKYGFINIHASLLPKWRGAAPIQRAIINQDYETGISIMRITEELDSGPIFAKYNIKIKDYDTSETVSKNLSQIAANNIINDIDNIFKNNSKFSEQDHKLATYATKIKKNESKIDWNSEADKIIAKINGLNPSPGAWFIYNDKRYKVWRAKKNLNKGKPGQILDKSFTIACKDGSIVLNEIQKEGKNRLMLDQFLLGMNFKVGEFLF